MGTPIVTFGGIVLGGSGLLDWEIASGSQPVTREFTLSRERAEAIAELDGPQTLRIEGPRKTLEVERIYLLEVLPTDEPFTRRVRLADSRWLWPKRWVATSYNLRRTTGDKFLAGEGRIENQLILPEIKYARFSLSPRENPSDPWTDRAAIEDVFFAQLDETVRFEDEPPDVELQDVELDDPGDAAVDRLFVQIPGMWFYLDRKGDVVVYDRFSGRERELLDRLPPYNRDGTQVQIVDRRRTRPAKVVVLFDVEAEVRLDHTEPSGTSSTSRDEDEPTLTQVGQVPDVSLTIRGEELARSSWADLSAMFGAWGAFGGVPDKIPVTFDVLRYHAFKHDWQSFVQAWGNAPGRPPDPVNLARAVTAVESWRRRLRIDRFWVQRAAAIKPYRAALLNRETGAYAPAAVYSDWVGQPTHKGHALGAADQNDRQGWAVRGWAESLSGAEPAPVRVEVLDEAAGIIELRPQVNPFGISARVVLGYPVGGTLPSQDMSLGDALFKHWDLVVLEPGWKCSVVLTVTPGSPNDIQRFYSVTVRPEDIEPDPGPSEGPTVYARVFPGVMTARFGWLDYQGEAIKAAFKDGGWPESSLVNGDDVRDVALATAKRIYDTLRDRPFGAPSFDLDPDIEPVGTVSRVHHVMDGGATTTSLAFSAVTQPADIWRYLNASTRKVIRKILRAQGWQP